MRQMSEINMKEILQRAETGSFCLEKDFDLKLLIPEVRRVIKEYEIRFDPEIIIPNDNSLADDVFNAALDLYLETGTYCVSTHRQIKFKESEIKEALRNAPKIIEIVTGSIPTYEISKLPKINW